MEKQTLGEKMAKFLENQKLAESTKVTAVVTGPNGDVSNFEGQMIVGTMIQGDESNAFLMGAASPQTICVSVAAIMQASIQAMQEMKVPDELIFDMMGTASAQGLSKGFGESKAMALGMMAMLNKMKEKAEN